MSEDFQESTSEQENALLELISQNPGSTAYHLNELSNNAITLTSWLLLRLLRKGLIVRELNQSDVPPHYDYYPLSQECNHDVQDK